MGRRDDSRSFFNLTTKNNARFGLFVAVISASDSLCGGYGAVPTH